MHLRGWGLNYQVDLGLQLNLKRLQCSLKLADLTSGRLEGLCAGRHLLAQLVKLEDMKIDPPPGKKKSYSGYFVMISY